MLQLAAQNLATSNWIKWLDQFDEPRLGDHGAWGNLRLRLRAQPVKERRGVLDGGGRRCSGARRYWRESCERGCNEEGQADRSTSVGGVYGRQQ